MNPNDPNFERHELLGLTDAMLNGTASPDDQRRLADILERSAEARQTYLRYAMVHGQLGLTPTLLADAERSLANPRPAPIHTKWKPVHVLRIAAVLAISTIVAWFVLSPSTKTDDLHYDNRVLPVQMVATLTTNESSNAHARISPQTFNVATGETRLDADNGATVRITGPALFGINSGTSGVLFGGRIQARMDTPDSTFSVLTQGHRIVDLGTEFTMSVLDHNRVRVEVVDGEVEVQSRNPIPVLYLSFDQPVTSTDDRFNVLMGPFTADPDKAARRVNGIVGSGAYQFDNTRKSSIRLHGKTGHNVGTGPLAFSSGLTIEAMIVSNWSGKHGDYDEIYRKEDGVHRVLLSFQNDAENNFDVPNLPPSRVLSFGIFLEGHGYSELDMPLDGRDGRPTLADLTDGQPHHVVATYDSFTGRKAIYIDGQRRYEHTFPVGSLILSGGPAIPTIGNHHSKEPFTGIIDELALYDFALTENVIKEHYQNASSGKPYFAAPTNADPWRFERRIRQGEQFVLHRFAAGPGVQ